MNNSHGFPVSILHQVLILIVILSTVKSLAPRQPCHNQPLLQPRLLYMYIGSGNGTLHVITLDGINLRYCAIALLPGTSLKILLWCTLVSLYLSRVCAGCRLCVDLPGALSTGDHGNPWLLPGVLQHSFCEVMKLQAVPAHPPTHPPNHKCIYVSVLDPPNPNPNPRLSFGEGETLLQKGPSTFYCTWILLYLYMLY